MTKDETIELTTEYEFVYVYEPLLIDNINNDNITYEFKIGEHEADVTYTSEKYKQSITLHTPKDTNAHLAMDMYKYDLEARDYADEITVRWYDGGIKEHHLTLVLRNQPEVKGEDMYRLGIVDGYMSKESNIDITKDSLGIRITIHTSTRNIDLRISSVEIVKKYGDIWDSAYNFRSIIHNQGRDPVLDESSSIPINVTKIQPDSDVSGTVELKDIADVWSDRRYFIPKTTDITPPDNTPSTTIDGGYLGGTTPKVITLIGSTKYPELFEEMNYLLSKQGHAVFTVCVYGHQIGMDMAGPVKKALDKGYMLKIARSDAVMVLNKNNYIGLGTCDELHYALALGKEIMWWKNDLSWPGYLAALKADGTIPDGKDAVLVVDDRPSQSIRGDSMTPVSLADSKTPYIVNVEESHNQNFKVMAYDVEGALELVKSKYNDGSIQLDQSYISSKQMAIIDPGSEATEWEEF